MNKKAKALIYLVSGFIAILSLFVFYYYIGRDKGNLEDVGETSGTLLAASMSFEMLIFFFIQALKRRLVPQRIKRYVVLIIKYLRLYHNSMGALAMSLLLFHISITIDLTNLFRSHLLTGYVITALVMISVLMGLFYKPKIKILITLHITFAWFASLPFLIHVA